MRAGQANRQLYNEVRAAFVRRGTTLNTWCKDQSLTRQYVEKCLKFERNGPAAHALRVQIAAAAGLDTSCADFQVAA